MVTGGTWGIWLAMVHRPEAGQPRPGFDRPPQFQVLDHEIDWPGRKV